MISAAVSAFIQAGVVLLLTAALWLFFWRKRSFPEFSGLKPAPWLSIAAGAAFGAAMAFAMLQFESIRNLASGENSVVASALGASKTELMVGLAITAVFKTAFSEELLFRGLIGKRLIGAFGFAAGNSMQAILFGCVHFLLLLIPQADFATVGIMVAITGASGWISGWINERLANGSILPGWAAHAVANVCSYLFLSNAWS